MPFFSKRVVLAAGQTDKVLDLPSGVELIALTVKAEGGTILLSGASDAVISGMTFTDGSGISLSQADLKALIRADKRLYAYSAAGADVELFGILGM
jgi:hypothetical protein